MSVARKLERKYTDDIRLLQSFGCEWQIYNAPLIAEKSYSNFENNTKAEVRSSNVDQVK